MIGVTHNRRFSALVCQKDSQPTSFVSGSSYQVLLTEQRRCGGREVGGGGGAYPRLRR